MKIRLYILGALSCLVIFLIAARYPVGGLVSSDIYTLPCDPNDGIYKFINPAPKDWTDRFGDNERTRIMHAISELRVVVAMQGRKIMELEKYHKEPNEVKP